MKKQPFLCGAFIVPSSSVTLFQNQFCRIILTILFVGIFTYCKAQTPLDGAVSFIGNEGYFKVVVADTLDVNEIDMMVGTESTPDEMFSHTFIYDQSTGLPSGVVYSRSGNEITIAMGTVTLQNAYSAKVRIKNSSNSWSDWYEFIGN